MSGSEVKALCVPPGSMVRRQAIWEVFCAYITQRNVEGFSGQVFIDGSYLTTKPEPGDVDFCLLARPEIAKKIHDGTIRIRMKSGPLIDTENELLHGFLVYLPPIGHRHYDLLMKQVRSWEKWWSHDQYGRPKGFASLTINPGEPWLI